MASVDSFEHFEVTAGGMTFRGWAAGPVDGRLVVLLHGFPQSKLEWRFQMEALAAEGYRAVAFDQRGYSPGARPEPVEPYGIQHLTADVLAVVDDMGGHQFDVVGHDWGAAVAWHLAGNYPERVRTLTAVSVPHPHAFGEAMASSDQAERSSYMLWFRNSPEEAEQQLLADDGKLLRTMFGDLGSAADEYVSLMKEPGAMAGALSWYRAIGKDSVGDLGPVTAPTLFVWSDGDVAISREAAEACGRHVEGPYRFEVVEGVDHWVPEKAAAQLNGLLLDHVARA